VCREDLFNVLARLTGTIAPVVHPAENSEAIDCRGARVLLAEDNAVNQEIARAMLEGAGCRVTIAVNGRMAVEHWLAQPYELVLMDCQMPELDGFEATRGMRTLEAASGARTPIVALTANAMDGDRERCLEAGMDDYLAKPFKRSELMAVLRRWIALTPRLPASLEPVPPAAGNEPGNAESAPADFDAAAFQATLPAGMGVNSPLARKLTRLFAGETAKLIAEIERAGADTQALCRAAHSLKSSGASVGASVVAGIAREMEALARAGQTAALADHAARLRVAYERYCAVPAIRDMLTTDSIERNAA
jgi:CheY-like chemotaxis protein/HPt (histidine-containing phosphotransfer) domain-containing protein